MSSTLGPHTTVEQMEDEIVFFDVLIASLDPHASDYRDRLAKLETKRAEWALALNGRRNDGLPNMDGASDSGRDLWWQTSMNGCPDSSHGSFGAMPPPSPANDYTPHAQHAHKAVNGVKRSSSSSHLYSGAHAAKRLTPEPSRAATPASSSKTFNTVRELDAKERAKRRQEAAEATMKRQYEAQRRDEALARQYGQSPAPFAPSSSRTGGVQTTLTHNGGFHRPPPPRIDTSHPFGFPPPSGAPRLPQSSPSNQGDLDIKSEPSPSQRSLAQRPRQASSSIVDLTESDDDEDLPQRAPADGSSSTPSGVHRGLGRPNLQRLPLPANTFLESNVRGFPQTSPMPGAWPSASMPHQQYVYSNSSGTNAFQSLVGAPSSRNMLYNPLPSLASVGSSVSNSMRHFGHNLLGSGSSTRPYDVDSDDDDDVIFSGIRQVSNYGTYTGREDLYRDRYDTLASYDPTKSKEEIQALLENIRPDEEMPAHLRVQTPDAMTIKLHKYQELGLTWLKQCEDGSNKGGILADDMGLGKTIQMLALIVTNKSEDPRRKTTLIVAPVALMRQWKQEIQQKIKSGAHALTVFTHHGTRKAKDFRSLQHYDIVLTTYGSLAVEVRKLEAFQLRTKGDPNAQPTPKEKCIFLDKDAQWYRVILDEAQCIKNKGTLTARAACHLNATYRFCVTGTPMMNNVEELYSLIRFLRIKPYCTWEKFRLDLSTPLRSPYDHVKEKAMHMLQALCKALMLRRTKKSTFEGKPILVLPERSTVVDNPIFDDDELKFYQALEGRTQLEFNKYLRRGTVGKSYSAILVLLLRLRQACCHPHLIRDFGVAAAADMTSEQMVELARQLDPATVERIKSVGGTFECPVCYDVTPNPAIFIPCGHDTCSECFTRISDPANLIRTGDEAATVKCPNCRGVVDPKRLTDFNSFKKVHMPELLTEAEQQNADAASSSDSEDSETESESDQDNESESETDSLNGFVCDDDVEQSEDDDTGDGLDEPVREAKVKTEKREESEDGPDHAIGDPIKASVKRSTSGSNKAKGKAKVKAKTKGSQKAKDEEKKKKKPKSTVTLAELKKMATRNSSAKKAYLKRLRKDWVSSAKIDKTMEILKDIVADNDDGEKVLIFSQWTSLLDLLEIPIDAAGYGYRRYDGSMNAKMRGDAVDDFRDDHQNVRIMLVSLKAGNAGLNLNMASQVIILDPFWNPYIEEQAIDRAHRIGQTRPVQVHRILIEETVEDRIIALQEKKRALISQALDEKSHSAIARLGVQELAYLFGVTSNPTERVDYTPRERR